MRRFLPLIFSTFILSIASGCVVSYQEESIDQFVPIEDVEAVAHIRKGLDFYKKSRFFEAELEFRRALKLFPTLPNAKQSLAVVLKKLGQFDESIELFEELLVENPESIAYLTGLGGVYFSKEEFQEAEQYYLRAYSLAVDKERADIASQLMENLYFMYLIEGKDEEALCVIELASQEFDAPVPAFIKYIRFLSSLGYHRFAREEILEKISVENQQSEYTLLSLRALQETGIGEFKEASKFYDLASSSEKGIGGAESSERKLISEIVAEWSGQTSDETDEEPVLEEDVVPEEVVEVEEESQELLFGGKPLESSLASSWPLSIISYLIENGSDSSALPDR